MRGKLQVIAGEVLFPALCAFFGATPISGQEVHKPNILFIAVDDLNCDFGAFGNTEVYSPYLDSLANEGVLFANNHAQKAVCGPSRASVLSGYTPEHTGIIGFHMYLRDMYPDVVTIPQFFKERGYSTIGMGKIHDPRNVSETDEVDLISWTEFVDVPKNRYIASSGKPVTESAYVEDEGYTDGRLAAEAVARIPDLITADKPFFLAVGFKKPHLPFAAPARYWNLYNRDSLSLHPFRSPALNDMEFVYNPGSELRNNYDDVPPEGSFPPELQREYIHGYYACVSYVDAQVGKIIRELRKQGAYENTIIVLWGDHGFSLGEHDNWGKHTNFEKATLCPLIIKAPGGIRGKVCQSPTELLDIYPTLADLSGFPVPDTLDGTSLRPIMEGESENVKSFAVSQFTRDGNQGFAMRSEYLQYVEWNNSDRVVHRQLFDLANDPYQTVNRAYAEDAATVVDSFSQRLDHYLLTGANAEPLQEWSKVDSLNKYRQFNRVEFTVNGIKQDTTLLADAVIKTGNLSIPTSRLGFAALQLQPGTYSYTIEKSGFVSSAGSFEVPHDLIIRDTLVTIPSKENFFMNDWEPLTAHKPGYVLREQTTKPSGTIISIDPADSSARKVSPYITGYNQPVHVKEQFHQKPAAVKHTRNASPAVLRYPGGTAAMSFFWDRSSDQGPPADVGTYLRSGEEVDDFRYGMTGGNFFSLDSYYSLLDSVEGLNSIIVVNYGYARYGRSETPVQQAAHYAADWVRYDNGRTKFWEIGNEISGSWTPGHSIDVTKNADGQPEVITGTLYAQHFRVFADSMKAAAMETGAEIRIGAVLSHTEDSWNKEFLENASDFADYVILHEYYGNEGETDPTRAFNAAGALKSHRIPADRDMLSYSDSLLPVVLTEWNTKDAQQNDACIYGMSNIYGIKNIIEAGYGLACRHTLFQKNERGLINTSEIADPDLAAWQPRSSFFYFYYLDRFFGDTYIPAEIAGKGILEVMSSSFSSGEIGVVVINKSGSWEEVSINLKNFTPSSAYYLYELSPAGYDPFSKKVIVNGHENKYYPEGGPFGYEDIKAFAVKEQDLVKFRSAPYSVNYILVEGHKEVPVVKHKINFRIYGRRGDSVFVIEDAVAAIGPQCAFSDREGQGSFMISPGEHDYRIEKAGFKSYNACINVFSDTTLTDTLENAEYDVRITLRDEDAGNPVNGITVYLNGNEMQVISTGEVMYQNVPGGLAFVEIDEPMYRYSESFEIFSDTTINLLLQEERYRAIFLITNRSSSDPVMEAAISIDGEEKTTGLNGQAQFELAYGDYVARVSKKDFRTELYQFTIRQDTMITFALAAEFVDAKFRVYHEGAPLNDVLVSVNNETGLTNALGMCTFSGLRVDTVYEYSLNKEGYETIDSSLTMKADTILDLEMKMKTFQNSYGYSRISIYPNPAREKVFIRAYDAVNEIRILDLTGELVVNVKKNTGKSAVLDIENLSMGIYLIQVKTGGMDFVQKIIIK